MQFVYKKRTASEDICRKIFQILAFFLVLYFSFWTNTAYMSGLHDQTDESCLGRFWATQNKNKLMAAWIQVVLAPNCYFLEGLQTPVTQTEEGTHTSWISSEYLL